MTCYFQAFENIQKLKKGVKNGAKHITISHTNVTTKQICKLKQLAEVKSKHGNETTRIISNPSHTTDLTSTCSSQCISSSANCGIWFHVCTVSNMCTIENLGLLHLQTNICCGEGRNDLKPAFRLPDYHCGASFCNTFCY
jgi:hypothetical protein